jgi:hypothetical protein
MDENKAVVWFADDPKPNRFFFQSPFRSWVFAFVTAATVGLSLATMFVVWRYWKHSSASSLLLVCFWCVVYPYLLALKSHRRINELYRLGQIGAQEGGTPLNELMNVAEFSMNLGLLNSTLLFVAFLLVTVIWKFNIHG